MTTWQLLVAREKFVFPNWLVSGCRWLLAVGEISHKEVHGAVLNIVKPCRSSCRSDVIFDHRHVTSLISHWHLCWSRYQQW